MIVVYNKVLYYLIFLMLSSGGISKVSCLKRKSFNKSFVEMTPIGLKSIVSADEYSLIVELD